MSEVLKVFELKITEGGDPLDQIGGNAFVRCLQLYYSLDYLDELIQVAELLGAFER